MLEKFITCQDRNKNIVGIEFTVVNKDDDNDSVTLETFGSVSLRRVTCRNLVLTDGRLDKISVYYDGTEEKISGVRYFKGERFVSFGNSDGVVKDWYFDSKNELIGVHGYLKDGIIVNVGFLIHSIDDAICQSFEE